MNRLLALAAVAAACSQAALAEPSKPVGTAMIEALGKCLDIADDKARLACTDVAGRKLVAAAKGREFVAVDRDEVHKARSQLFGFALPATGLFDQVLGGKVDREAVPDRLEATVRRVSADRYGLWTLTLDEGAEWQTTEPWSAASDPRTGSRVTIKRGAFGGYMLTVGGGRPVRARRVG